MIRRQGRQLYRATRRRGNRTTYYVPGDHNVVSDETGLVFKRSECRLTWDSLLVELPQWDPKQPQLDIRGKPDRIAVSIARPEEEIVFETDTTAADL